MLKPDNARGSKKHILCTYVDRLPKSAYARVNVLLLL